jgi:hypothetical protein
MKFRDIVSIAKNSRNNQINFSLKKTKMKEIDFDLDDVLDIKIKKEKD